MFYFSYSARIKGAKQSIDKFLSLTYAFGNTPPEDGWLDFAEIFVPLLFLKGGMNLRANHHRLLVIDAVVDIAFAQQKVHEIMD